MAVAASAPPWVLAAQPEPKPVERVWQEAAWESLFTYEAWFRRHYNLAPTDPRYLTATPRQIRVDFWSHILWARFEQARKDGREPAGLDELLEAPEEAFETQLREMDERLAKEAAAPSRGTHVGTEPVIAFQATEA